MAKLSLIFPSRDERFLIPSIHDAMKNARGEFECIAVIDSDKWPEGWKEVCDKYPNLHTIFHGTSKGMRAAINSGAGSAISRGAKYIAKFDAHCSFSEGFDEILKAECEPNWIVVPRRGRLDPEAWTATETHKPDIDYHYLSFPDNPDDFGGPGLNGKPWDARSRERKDILLDEEMSSQGSGWFMHASYFAELELMDESNYGPFWNEFQEVGLKCWLSGGKVMVNKKAKYLHLHKGKKYGRGYHLPESWLQQGRTHANLWAFNEAWPKQTLPFEWLIDHFWPVPTWPENWREVLYATRKPRAVVGMGGLDTAVLNDNRDGDSCGDEGLKQTHWDEGDWGKAPKELQEELRERLAPSLHPRSAIAGQWEEKAAGRWKGTNAGERGLVIHKAHYGIGSLEDIDVRERLQNLAYLNKDSLDIVVNNSTLTPGQNPFRGKKKQLNITYSIDGGDVVTRTVEEKDWLIIGPTGMGDGSRKLVEEAFGKEGAETMLSVFESQSGVRKIIQLTPDALTAAALNDYLIRRFQVSPQRLRGPMPIELRDFHRNDLAQLFAELGFKRMAEVGVAEGNFSEVLLKANPEVELILVDPWGDVDGNTQSKGSNRHKFAYEETKRKTAPYPNVRLLKNTSMGVVGGFKDGWFDAVYLDANHSYPFIMEDLINWTRKVRSGGIVALDDIYKLDEARWGAGPMEAIYDYTRAMRINPWWLIAAHKSVDAFFVKP